MHVLILAAGYGTRLYELGKDTPKALLKVNNKPLIDFILDRVRILEFVRGVTVVTNDKFFPNFKQWQAQHENWPYPITIVNDGTLSPEDRLGSIGDIDFVIKKRRLDTDLLVVGGDNLFDFNIKDYMRFSQSKSPRVSIGLYDIASIEQARKFGVVTLDEDGKIIDFKEKPRHPKATLIAMCFYYFPKETLPYIAEYLAQTAKSDTAGDYIRWLYEKKDVYGFKFSGQWYDIGSLESYHEAQKSFRN